MFKVETMREEKAYRLGYCEGYNIARRNFIALYTRSHSVVETYKLMGIFFDEFLWSWYEKETPELDEPAPDLMVTWGDGRL